jgi:hypothetical protein
MVMLGDHAGAVSVVEKNSANTLRIVRQLGPVSWTFLFNPATVYAQAYDRTLIDAKLTAERRTELASQYCQKAVTLLREARKLAGSQFEARFLTLLRTDPALDPIREHPEFRDALKTLDPQSTTRKEQ